MTTYNGLNKNELIAKIAEAKAKICKAENEKRFGDGIARKNENPNTWENFYKSYPIYSEKYPMFSLSAEYRCYCENI